MVSLASQASIPCGVQESVFQNRTDLQQNGANGVLEAGLGFRRWDATKHWDEHTDLECQVKYLNPKTAMKDRRAVEVDSVNSVGDVIP